MIAFDSIAQMLQDTEQSGLPLWENILESDCRRQDLPRARSLERMGAMLDAMVQADESYQAQDRSHSGLSGGDGAKMTLYAAGDPLCGPLLSQVMAGALRMGECNACMKRIVAAPTAGACGVLPAVLLPCARHFSLSREQLVQALYVASGFGMVIAARASISGAEGGCQAEIGSAAAMAAPALVHLRGGTPSMMAHACAMAVKNLLGLVCDPVGGAGGGPLRQAQRHRGHGRPFGGPDGSGRHREPGPPGPGSGRHGRGGPFPAPLPPGDGKGRPGRNALWDGVRTQGGVI